MSSVGQQQFLRCLITSPSAIRNTQYNLMPKDDDPVILNCGKTTLAALLKPGVVDAWVPAWGCSLGRRPQDESGPGALGRAKS